MALVWSSQTDSETELVLSERITSRANLVDCSFGCCAGPLHVMCPDTLNVPELYLISASIFVTSHACFGENLKSTLWDGLFSIDVPLLKNIVLEDAV